MIFHGYNNEDNHFYPEPAYDELQVGQDCAQHVPSFDLPKYNHLFDQVKLAPMELTDFSKFSAAKLYYQYYDLHVSDELNKYSWLLSASCHAPSTQAFTRRTSFHRRSGAS
jgi:hypothetical protein